MDLKRKQYMLQYEDAKEIVSSYNNHQFWETQFKIDDYKVSTFNYFLCGYDDFMFPLGDKSNVTAFDMRGTCFVFDKNDNLCYTFYMLPKFFNINQVEETQYDNIKDKKIQNIGIKEDGSLIGFMKLPNNKIISKTIGSFVSDQSIEAMKILNSNPEWKAWVNNMLDLDYTPLFEYVSYDNRIVLKYNKKQIKFIGLRDNSAGDFIPSLCPIENHLDVFNEIPSDMKQIWSIKAPLDDLIELSKTAKGIEGWVVLFEDGQLVKVKTEEYFKLHGIRTENIFREDYVIHNFLDEKLDDIISQLDKETDQDAFDFIDIVVDAVKNFIGILDNQMNIYNDWFINRYNSDFKQFAINHHKDKFFNVFKNFLDTENYNKRKIEFIKKKTAKLKRAKEFVELYKK